MKTDVLIIGAGLTGTVAADEILRNSDLCVLQLSGGSGASPPALSKSTSPSIAIRPEVGSVNPAIILSSVVLPQPDGPTTETSSPSPTVSDT